jgi:hypothetical protein
MTLHHIVGGRRKRLKPNTETQGFNVENLPMRKKNPRTPVSHHFYYFREVFIRMPYYFSVAYKGVSASLTNLTTFKEFGSQLYSTHRLLGPEMKWVIT